MKFMKIIFGNPMSHLVGKEAQKHILSHYKRG